METSSLTSRSPKCLFDSTYYYPSTLIAARMKVFAKLYLNKNFKTISIIPGRKLLEFIATNRVVKEKMTQEYQRILALGNSCLGVQVNQTTKTELQKEGETLKVKTLAFSDLVAVYRSA